MKLVKDYIEDEDKMLAKRIIDKLKLGNRVFGNPGEGLKQTLKKLEDDLAYAEKNKGALDFLDNDGDIRANIAKIKAGINGEETLAEYFEKIVKYDEKLQDIILFASVSDPNHQASEDYISDSDFIAVYGNNILILDAKNIMTNPELPIYLDGNDLVAVGGATILELHPSTYVWKKILQNNDVTYISLNGCVVIVNKKGASIWKNQDWHKSDVKPVHISDLVNFLHNWIENKTPEVNLSLITTLAKMQIKKEDSGLNIRDRMRRFGV